MVFRPTIIISIIFLLASILMGVFLTWPKFQEFRGLSSDLEALEKEVIRREEYFNNLKVVSGKMENYSVELAKIDSALAIDPSIPALFDFIKKSAAESGLALVSLNLVGISPSFDTVGIKEIDFSLSVSGTYSAFKNFLSAVYRNSRLFEVNDISFSSPQDNNLFNFNLSLKTYSYMPKGEAEELKRE